MSSVDIYKRALELAEAGQPFVLASVIVAQGSTPQKAGANAVFEPAGKMAGTLGGGCLEAESRRRALQALDAGTAEVFDLKLDDVKGWDDGLICGGSVRVLVNPLAAGNAAVYRAALAAKERQERGVLATVVGHPELPMGAAVWTPEAALDGEALLAGDAAGVRERMLAEQPGQWLETDGNGAELYLEPVLGPPRLVVAGGGHIGQAVCHLGSRLGFEVTVIDDRPTFASAERHPTAKRAICGDIAGELSALEIGPQTYILIVTRGHRHDGSVLAACVKSGAAYIGMIGSRRKSALIRRTLLDEGHATRAEIERVVSPIGVDIGAQSVEEIAVSIVAELVAVRRKGALTTDAKNFVPGGKQ
jgi:xanthine dehydrogenase accessory factor